jgi:hypothetical protein
VNRFEVVRRRVVLPEGEELRGISDDLAIPVVDGQWLSKLLDDAFPGVDVGLVAPPSKQWLGEPSYAEHGRAVVLDGGCGEAGCCGVVARIQVRPTEVRWSEFYGHGRHPPYPADLEFTFDRSDYEAALRSLRNLEPEPWRIDE